MTDHNPDVAAVRATGPWCGPYTLGRWSDFVQHVDPCDCDFDDEETGDRCMDNSDWTFAVFSEGGAFAERLVCKLPRTPPEDDDDDGDTDGRRCRECAGPMTDGIHDSEFSPCVLETP